MIFKETKLEDVYIIIPEFKNDTRGYFTRVFCTRELKKQFVNFPIVQVNQSMSYKVGTIRGLHMQKEPYSEDKLIQCLKGSIFDVIIDLRKRSKTYGQYFTEVLSWENRKMMLVPKGCAHGYQTLKDNSIIQYPVSEFYSPKYEDGIRWNDPFFKIKWPITSAIVSKKDSSWPDFV